MIRVNINIIPIILIALLSAITTTGYGDADFEYQLPTCAVLITKLESLQSAKRAGIKVTCRLSSNTTNSFTIDRTGLAEVIGRIRLFGSNGARYELNLANGDDIPLVWSLKGSLSLNPHVTNSVTISYEASNVGIVPINNQWLHQESMDLYPAKITYDIFGISIAKSDVRGDVGKLKRDVIVTGYGETDIVWRNESLK